MNIIITKTFLIMFKNWILRCWVAVCRIFLLNYVNGYSCFRGYIVKIRTLNNFLIHENFSFIHSHRIKLNANVLFCLSYLTKYKDEVCMNQTSIIRKGNPRKDHLLQCAQHTYPFQFTPFWVACQESRMNLVLLMARII